MGSVVISRAVATDLYRWSLEMTRFFESNNDQLMDLNDYRNP